MDKARLLLEALNTVTYCTEVVDAWNHAGGLPFHASSLTAAKTRLAKARTDLAQVQAGVRTRLDRYHGGGFPLIGWVSGYFRSDGVYVPGQL